MKYAPFLFLILVLALPARAATVSVEPASLEAPPAGAFSFTVSLATDANPVNVVEGSLRVPAGVVVDSVSAAGSAFTLWPTYPGYFATDRAIEFSGGTPGGVAAGAHAVLFTVNAHADAAGVYTFSFAGVSAYRNDGKGTVEDTASTGASVTVHAGAKAAAASAGKPSALVADIGRDDALFGGQYFVTFYGGDRGAGVRYEVREGSGAFQPAERYYVLRDQTLKTPVTVRAVDARGVAAQVTLNGNGFAYLALALILLLAALGAFWYARRRRAPAV